MDEKKKSPLGCDFSGWYNAGKIVKIVATHVLRTASKPVALIFNLGFLKVFRFFLCFRFF